MKYRQPIFAIPLIAILLVCVGAAIAGMLLGFAPTATWPLGLITGFLLMAWMLALLADAVSYIEITDDTIVASKFGKTEIPLAEISSITFGRTNPLVNFAQGSLIRVAWRGKEYKVNIFRSKDEIEIELKRVLGSSDSTKEG